MGKYSYFKKGELDVHLHDGVIVVAPEFINKGAKNYRYNMETSILEKKCISCNRYFEVQKHSEGTFVDIDDEDEIHYFSENSGYQGKCRKCLNENSFVDTVESTAYFSESGLTEINQSYIRILSLIKKQSEESTLNFVVDIVRKHNKIDYTEKIN